MIINNLPAYALFYNYIVVSCVNNEFWFYGSFNDHEQAMRIANEINGRVIYKCEIAGRD